MDSCAARLPRSDAPYGNVPVGHDAAQLTATHHEQRPHAMTTHQGGSLHQ